LFIYTPHATLSCFYKTVGGATSINRHKQDTTIKQLLLFFQRLHANRR